MFPEIQDFSGEALHLISPSHYNTIDDNLDLMQRLRCATSWSVRFVFYDILSSRFVQAVILTLITILITQIALAKGKLRWSLRHQHYYSVPNMGPNGTDLPIITQELWFNNTGRAAVEDIEIVLNWNPMHFEIWSPRQHDPGIDPNGRLIIKLPSLAPKEFFTVSLLDTKELPALVNVRSKNSEGKRIDMMPVRQFSTTVNAFIAILMLIGLATLIYWLLSGLASAWVMLPPSAP